MKTGTFLLICLLVLGCVIGSDPVILVNALGPHLYEKNTCWPHLSDEDKKRYDEFLNDMFFGSMVIFLTKWTGHCKGYYDTVEVYQSPDSSCFLFSYNPRDLFQQKIAAGYDPQSHDALFLLMPHGVKLVSRAQYEDIKPTLKPHPYDPSLCKPNPHGTLSEVK